MAITGVNSENKDMRVLVKELVVDGQPVTPGGETTVAWGDVTEKPETFPPTIGTTGTTAAAGNHTHSFTTLLGDVQGATGENLQEILTAIVSRLAALEA